ncbi:MAG: hypothetical protein ACFCVE_12125 [Phycisphaerae bacterium]
MLLLFTGCEEGDNEARGRARAMEDALAKAEARVSILEDAVGAKEEQINRLTAQLAAAEGGKPFTDQEREETMDKREAALDRFQHQLAERESRTRQHEDELIHDRQQLDLDRQEFHVEAATLREAVGEARRTTAEFENMRAERDHANSTSERWLIAFWLATGFAVVLIVGLTALLIRAWGKRSAMKDEMRHRTEMAQIVMQQLDTSNPERSLIAVKALKALAPISDGTGSQAQPPSRQGNLDVRVDL